MAVIAHVSFSYTDSLTAVQLIGIFEAFAILYTVTKMCGFGLIYVDKRLSSIRAFGREHCTATM